MKKICIIGGGLLQTPLIKSVKERNYLAVVLDGDCNAVGKDLADIFLTVDIREPEKCIYSLKRQNIHPEAVITVGTDFSYSTAVIARYFDTIWPEPEQCLKATNKILMRNHFAQANIMQPVFIPLFQDEINLGGKYIANKLAEKKLSYPVVVKPADSMGGRGTKLCYKLDELNTAALKALRHSIARQIIIEEYIEGQEYSVDALIFNGRVQICGIADRIIDKPPFFIELGHIIPTQADMSVRRAVEDFFITCIHSLKIKNGFAKGDIRVSQGVVYLGEIATRLSGGFMSGFTYPLAANIHLYGHALDLVLGQDPGVISQNYPFCSIEKGFIAPQEGLLKNIEGIEQIKKIKEVKYLFLNYQKNQMIKFPKNNTEKGGNVIVVDKDYKSAEEKINFALEQIKYIF